jgi:hypothetical protein
MGWMGIGEDGRGEKKKGVTRRLGREDWAGHKRTATIWEWILLGAWIGSENLWMNQARVVRFGTRQCDPRPILDYATISQKENAQLSNLSLPKVSILLRAWLTHAHWVLSWVLVWVPGFWPIRLHRRPSTPFGDEIISPYVAGCEEFWEIEWKRKRRPQTSATTTNVASSQRSFCLPSLFFLRLWRVSLRGPGNFAKKRTDPSAFSKNRRRNIAPDGSNDSLHMTHFFSSLRRDWDRWINNNQQQQYQKFVAAGSILSGFFQEQVEVEAGTQNWRPFCKSPRWEHYKNLSSVFLNRKSIIFWYSSDPVLSNIMANCIPPTVRELTNIIQLQTHKRNCSEKSKPWRIAYTFMK